MKKLSYISPDSCFWEIQSLNLIAQSLTGETYDNPLVYDGF